MALIFIRRVRPVANVWRGRRLLAVSDAVAWPALWIFVLWNLPFYTGIAGQLAIAIATFFGLSRVLKAWIRTSAIPSPRGGGAELWWH